MVKALDKWSTVHIALGSNMYGKKQNLDTALEHMQKIDGLEVKVVSDFIETEPEGFESENAFLNAVAKCESNLHPEVLLKELLAIENELGRKRVEGSYSDRPIDLDIITYGNGCFKSVDLVVPHPHMHTRSFVLEPLKSIDPNWKHPVFNKNAADFLVELG